MKEAIDYKAVRRHRYKMKAEKIVMENSPKRLMEILAELITEIEENKEEAKLERGENEEKSCKQKNTE